MTLRRNVITLLIWLSVLAIFTIHVIMTRQRDSTKIQINTKKREMSVSKHNVLINSDEDIQIKDEKGFIDSLKSFFEFPYGHVHPTTTRKTIIKGDENTDQNQDYFSGSAENTDFKIKHNGQQEACNTHGKSMKDLQEKLKELQTRNTYLETEKEHYRDLSKTLTKKLSEKNEFHVPRLDSDQPWVFAITPTFSRYTQKAELVRLSQTLMLVTNLHWIVVEDSNKKTDLVKNLLHESGLSYTHLNIRTPVEHQRKRGEKYNKHPRGVLQRNTVLHWIKENVDLGKTPGVMYFMDDDNTYHRKLFDEIRWTKRVSVWPVALTGGLKWAGPILNNGKFVRFRTDWALDRKFPIDMAGFAINIKYWSQEKNHMQFNMTARRGYMETNFLERLTSIDEVEFLADNCTKILVWHTRTETPKLNIKGEHLFIKKEDKTFVPDMEV